MSTTPAARICRAWRCQSQTIDSPRGLIHASRDGDITLCGRAIPDGWWAALAYAAALVSGCGLVLLDRFDVLDVPARSQFMRLAIAQASYGVQTIAAGTLKAPPAAIAGATQVVWLGEGEKK